MPASRFDCGRSGLFLRRTGLCTPPEGAQKVAQTVANATNPWYAILILESLVEKPEPAPQRAADVRREGGGISFGAGPGPVC